MFFYFVVTAASFLTKRSKGGKLPPCDSKKLVDFLAEIQVINPESIIQQATLNDLGPMCK